MCKCACRPDHISANQSSKNTGAATCKSKNHHQEWSCLKYKYAIHHGKVWIQKYGMQPNLYHAF